MLTPNELKKAFLKVEEENMTFRLFLKNLESDEIDNLVNKIHRELFAQADCIGCSNCCKVIVPNLNNDDITRISRSLGLFEQDFRTSYLENIDGEWMFSSKPCPFLTEKGCTIYNCRPEVCRKYPFTDQNELGSRLLTLVSNGEVCPVVYEILERLKTRYRKEYQRYKRVMSSCWR